MFAKDYSASIVCYLKSQRSGKGNTTRRGHKDLRRALQKKREVRMDGRGEKT